MKTEEEKVKEKKEKIKNWLKKPLNLTFIGVMLFAFVIRFHYFLMTKSQPLWWDELAYGSLAKNFLSHAWDGTPLIIRETLIRPPLFPFIWSLFLRLNFNEITIRFLLEFIPSILSVYLVYLIGKEFYNQRIGLIAAFIFSVFWIHLFYATRLMTNVPAMFLLFLSIYLFIKSQQTGFNSKYFGISIFFLSLSTLIRYPIGIVFVGYAIFLLLTKKFYILKDSKFWISGIFGILPILLFFIFNLATAGNIFPAFFGDDYIDTGPAKPFAWNVLSFIPIYLKNIFFVFFLIGATIVLFELVLGYDFINKRKKLQAHLILLLTPGLMYFFFIFYMRAIEDRWILPTTLSMALFAAIGFDYTYNLVKRYHKLLAVIILLAILIIGAKPQLTHADQLIKNKKESYLQMKQSFEWMKYNIPEGSVILGAGIEPYAVYYSEMKYEQLPKNISDVNSIKADYLVIHLFIDQPKYIDEYLRNNKDKWQPINAYFFDSQKQQPAVVIYKNTQQLQQTFKVSNSSELSEKTKQNMDSHPGI